MEVIPLRDKFGFNWSGTKRWVGSWVGKQTHQEYPQVLEKFEYTSLAHGGKVYRWQDEDIIVEDRGWQNQEVFVEEHPVITQARNGDLIRVIRHVKGIGGIGSYEMGALKVRAFRMTLQHKPIEGQREVNKNSCSTWCSLLGSFITRWEEWHGLMILTNRSFWYHLMCILMYLNILSLMWAISFLRNTMAAVRGEPVIPGLRSHSLAPCFFDLGFKVDLYFLQNVK